MRNRKLAIIEPKSDRKHCPDCCFYLDGVKMAHDETGSIRFHSMPGMQFHIKSTGTIYDKLGHNTPCHCATGNEVAYGYSHDADGSKHHSVNLPCSCNIHAHSEPADYKVAAGGIDL